MKQILALLLLTTGCKKAPEAFTADNATQDSSANEALIEAADQLWEDRGNKDSLTQALSKYEEAFKADISNREVGYKLTRGWYFIGDAHESELENKLAAWEKAISFGEACLSINADFKATLEKGGEKVEAINAATIDDVPCAYWTASALGKWAKNSGIAVTLKHIPTAKAYISKVGELDNDYYYGAVDRYWGAYYSGLPSFAGQDLNKSKGHFDNSISIAPGNLANRVLVADYWAVKSQDIATFDENIQYVMAADTRALIPDLQPENEAEKKKAAALWEKRGELFLDPPEAQPLQEQPPVYEEPVEDTVEETVEETTEEAPAEDGAEDPAEGEETETTEESETPAE